MIVENYDSWTGLIVLELISSDLSGAEVMFEGPMEGV
jgi:hypothetical protein